MRASYQPVFFFFLMPLNAFKRLIQARAMLLSEKERSSIWPESSRCSLRVDSLILGEINFR